MRERKLKEVRRPVKVAKKVKNVVKCDNCSQNIAVNPRYKKEGELEYRYFTCRRCKSVYVISVTDESLRENIKRYEKIIEATIVSPEAAQEAQLMLENNVKRSRELKAQYPLELKAWEK